MEIRIKENRFKVIGYHETGTIKKIEPKLFFIKISGKKKILTATRLQDIPLIIR